MSPGTARLAVDVTKIAEEFGLFLGLPRRDSTKVTAFRDSAGTRRSSIAAASRSVTRQCLPLHEPPGHACLSPPRSSLPITLQGVSRQVHSPPSTRVGPPPGAMRPGGRSAPSGTFGLLPQKAASFSAPPHPVARHSTPFGITPDGGIRAPFQDASIDLAAGRPSATSPSHRSRRCAVRSRPQAATRTAMRRSFSVAYRH
jgi:hypothetical protein